MAGWDWVHGENYLNFMYLIIFKYIIRQEQGNKDLVYTISCIRKLIVIGVNDVDHFPTPWKAVTPKLGLGRLFLGLMAELSFKAGIYTGWKIHRSHLRIPGLVTQAGIRFMGSYNISYL